MNHIIAIGAEGSPNTKEEPMRKDTVIRARVTAEFKKELEDRAEKKGISMSELIRQQADAEKKKADRKERRTKTQKG